MDEIKGKAKNKKKEPRRQVKKGKKLPEFVYPGKISCSYTNAKMRAIIHKKNFSF